MMRLLDLAEAIDAGDLTPASVIELAAEAIAAREKEVQAFAHLDLERARIAASRIAADDGFFGLPVAVKDIIDTADMPTAYGSPIYARHRPKADAAIIVRAREAQGIVIGKSATAEFAYTAHPATRNPHDPAFSPGISSSGSAAAVAAGMVPLAFGTQTGGSTIRPASYCGVAAIKPSYRLLPMQGIKPFSPLLDTLGLFGARIVDIAYALEVLSRRPMRVDGGDFGTPSFGILRQEFLGPVEAASEAALAAIIRAAEAGGAAIRDVASPPEWAAGAAAHRVIIVAEGADSLGYERRHHARRLSPVLRDALERGRALPAEDYDLARRDANHARKGARAVFEGFDALITFSAPGEAPPYPETDGGQFNRLPTLLGLPAINLPVITGAKGLPVGVQILGRFGEDRRALAAAAWLEARIGRSRA